MAKSVWTPEKARRRRELKGGTPIGKRETRLSKHIPLAGRELQAMLDCPARDWPTSKWANLKPGEF